MSKGRQARPTDGWRFPISAGTIQGRGFRLLRIAAIILGVLGGLAGLVRAIFALFVGGVGAALEVERASNVIVQAWVALGLSVVGIVGGALAGAKPKTSGVLMLVAGVGGLIAVSIAYIIAAPLLVVGGVLPFFSGRTKAA